MKKIVLIISLLLLSLSVYGIDNNKPADHTDNWIYNHGQSAKADENTCFSCHDDRALCISCHEDKSPRSHTATFVNKTHGFQVRLNKSDCQVCHKVDFCNACHETAKPLNHNRKGFKNGANSHCGTCIEPIGSWKNTPNKNCITCHQSRPLLSRGGLHPMK